MRSVPGGLVFSFLFLLWSFSTWAGTAKSSENSSAPKAVKDAKFKVMRDEMVKSQIVGRGDVENSEVIAALRTVPRHLFVQDKYQELSYEDRPLPILAGQTISQPYIVAKMSDLAGVGRGAKVLEIGTGSGYQAAVLAEMGAKVFSVEIISELTGFARRNLERAGYGDQVDLKTGDGYKGWPENAPYDAVIVTAAAERIPDPLVEQLKIGGKLVIPVGKSGIFSYQELLVIEKKEDGLEKRNIFPVAFVPMTGEIQSK